MYILTCKYALRHNDVYFLISYILTWKSASWHFFPFDLLYLSAFSLLYFSSVHIIGNLTSKFLSVNILNLIFFYNYYFYKDEIVFIRKRDLVVRSLYGDTILACPRCIAAARQNAGIDGLYFDRRPAIDDALNERLLPA